MEEVKYLIIGGGIAGTTAAETIRRNDPDGSIAIVSDEPYRLYSRIMLSKPNFFLEKIPFDQIWLKKESWYAENKINFLGGRTAVKLDSTAKVVTLDNAVELHYEKLLLAIGGCARKWDTAGASRKGIYYLRTLDHAKEIISAVKSAKQAVAVGGGFISFEMCDMLKLAGLDVTLVMRENHYWEPLLDETSGRLIEEALERGGVKIIRKAEIGEIMGQEAIEGVVLKDGAKIPCQMLVMGIGVYCPFEWIRTGGVEVNRGILANEYLETNIPDIWTAGDCAEFNDIILKEKVQLGNWVNAQSQGRIAGLSMVGKKEIFKLVSFYTTIGFGITIAFTGDVRVTPDCVVIQRGSAADGAYGRIIVKNNCIVGATLINRTADLSPLSKLIEKNVNVSGQDKELADSTFNLAELIPK